jgi:hypothetical protein
MKVVQQIKGFLNIIDFSIRQFGLRPFYIFKEYKIIKEPTELRQKQLELTGKMALVQMKWVS